MIRGSEALLLSKPVHKKSLFNFGYNKEEDYFFENLSILMSSGMPVSEAVLALGREIRTPKMTSRVETLKREIDSGSSLYVALENSKLLPKHFGDLIRVGESSGLLVDNFNIIVDQRQRERVFGSQIKVAMAYPLTVMIVALLVGVAITWFLLPGLSGIFSSMKIELPWITRVMIGFGKFISTSGYWALPLFMLAVFIIFYLVFSYKKTKYIGEYIILHLPRVKKIIQDSEVARFSYLLGSLLKAGLPIDTVMGFLAESAKISAYKKFYSFAQKKILDGDSLARIFSAYRGIDRLIPIPIQQTIISAENSGRLSEASLHVSSIFEARMELNYKLLTTMLEPILLVIVWLGVLGIALAIVLPIYSLIGGMNQQI
ncbi:MAG: type II secretion system F family protein [Patescibacteria group bacterium]